MSGFALFDLALFDWIPGQARNDEHMDVIG